VQLCLKNFYLIPRKYCPTNLVCKPLEAVGLAVIGLIFVALIFNSTKSGLDETAGKVGNTLDAIGGADGLPDQINP
jgi:hypothetical protein